ESWQEVLAEPPLAPMRCISLPGVESRARSGAIDTQIVVLIWLALKDMIRVPAPSPDHRRMCARQVGNSHHKGTKGTKKNQSSACPEIRALCCCPSCFPTRS